MGQAPQRKTINVPVDYSAEAIKSIWRLSDQNGLAVRIFTRGDVSGMEGPQGLLNLTDAQWNLVKDRYEESVLDYEWEYLLQLAMEAKRDLPE